MRIVNFGVSIAAVLAVAVSPSYAQGRGGPHVTHATPHTTTTTTTKTPTTTTNTTTTNTTTTTTTTTTPNAISTKIQSHPQLASRVTALLPAGMTLDTASSGFRNQGQFLAALHVSHNLNISFADLKTTMLGTSKTPGMSLGQAIHKLRPSADSTTETRHAVTQASSDLDDK